VNQLYPIVVPASYFEIPREVRQGVRPGLDTFGIVRPLGSDLFSVLACADGEIIKNVHEDELPAMGLDRTTAERAALKNLSTLAESRKTIERQVNKTPSGLHFAVWMGDRFTSSCILWPGLYEWACRALETDQLIAMAPQVQLMCVAARGNPEFRAAIKGYMEKVVSDMEKQISTEWFALTPNGIAPLDAE
jgi:hypothetical protein